MFWRCTQEFHGRSGTEKGSLTLGAGRAVVQVSAGKCGCCNATSIRALSLLREGFSLKSAIKGLDMEQWSRGGGANLG